MLVNPAHIIPRTFKPIIPLRLGLFLFRGLLLIALIIIFALKAGHLVIRLVRLIATCWEATATSKLGEIDATEVAAAYGCKLASHLLVVRRLSYEILVESLQVQ